MKKLFKILVPFDFSDTANNALNYVKNFVADDLNTEIILVYVNEIDDEQAEKKLEAIREEFQAHSRNTIRAIVKKGLLQSALIEVEKAEKIDLIFMGTSLVNNKKLNTNTSSFVLVVDCPIIVIPKDYENFKIKKIALVIGEDLIHDSKLLGVLLQVARRFKARVHVLTVKQGEADYGYTIVDEKNENTIMYYLEDFYSHHLFVDGPDIPTSIFKYAEEKDIDLISILPRNHAKGKVSSEGALTKSLSEVSKTPLLVID